MQNIINDASVNEWFSQQMASLSPMKMVLALAIGFFVGVIIALFYRTGAILTRKMFTTVRSIREFELLRGIEAFGR